MAALPPIPQRFYSQQGNGIVYLSWDLAPGATSYSVQRSTDGVTYSEIATPGVPNYTDSVVVLGTQYYYKIASVNSTSTSPYTSPQSLVPTPNGEMSLGELRTNCQQRADRVNSDFVTTPEWNSYINQSMYELYDLLISADSYRYVAPTAQFSSNGNTYLYPLPDGQILFTMPDGSSAKAAPLYQLLGVDLAVNNANNAWVTIDKFNFIDRNKFLYPNTASTIYGVFNCQYRLLGTNVEFIPTPAGNQLFRFWYIPKLPILLADNAVTQTNISGWLEYVITDAAIKALQKEESDVSTLMAQKVALIKRIEEMAPSRDAGRPDTISDVRSSNIFGGGMAAGGFKGGF